jgi:hypothetical protein
MERLRMWLSVIKKLPSHCNPNSHEHVTSTLKTVYVYEKILVAMDDDIF